MHSQATEVFNPPESDGCSPAMLECSPPPGRKIPKVQSFPVLLNSENPRAFDASELSMATEEPSSPQTGTALQPNSGPSDAQV